MRALVVSLIMYICLILVATILGGVMSLYTGKASELAKNVF